MPTFQTCAVLLDGEKEVYRKGETVAGSLVLDVTENVIVKAVRVYLYGETLVKWDEYSSEAFAGTRDFIAKEKYIGFVLTVFGKKQNTDGPNPTLTAGRHNYRYKFNIPKEGLPSSYEGEYGAIRFWLKVEVDRPFPSFDQCWYHGITVLDDINVNESQYKEPIRRTARKQVSKALGLGNAGSLTLNVATDRGAYCPGEKVALKVVVKNETTKDMGKLKAELEQKVVFTANNETKTLYSVIRILEGSPVKRGAEQVWNNQLLNVDAIPPSTKPRSCHIIVISYCIKVLVEVPFAFDLETIVPITIGTIPYGHAPAAGAPRGGATASGGAGIDASAAITYTKCNRGFETFDGSDGNFVNYIYTPMCAYVVNYTFPPPRSAATAAARPHSREQTRTVSQDVKVPPADFAQAPLQPSAPPMAMPPTYEDVLRKTAITVEKVDKPYGLLFVRFPDACVTEFRDIIVGEQRSLAECEGNIIAFAPQVIHEPDQWPTRTSIAMLKFPSIEVATDWFHKTLGVADPKWLETCDAIVGIMKEQFRKANRIFSISTSRLKVLPQLKARLTKLLKLYDKTLRPLRISKTGVCLVVTSKYITLRGKWVEDNYSITATHWKSMDLFYEWKSETKCGPNKECYDMYKELYDEKEGIVFQSEDLSLFQMTSIQTENPAIEIQSEYSRAQSEDPGVEIEVSGERQTEIMRSDSPAIEVQSQNINSVATQTPSEASADGNEAEGEEEEEEEETADIKTTIADLQ